MTSHPTNQCAWEAGHRDEVGEQQGGAAMTGTNGGQWEVRISEWAGRKAELQVPRSRSAATPPVRDRGREDAGTPRRTRGWGDIPHGSDSSRPRNRSRPCPRRGKAPGGGGTSPSPSREHQLRPPAAHDPSVTSTLGTPRPSRALPVPLEMPALAAAPTETRTDPGAAEKYV